jgi:hypothetical protein
LHAVFKAPQLAVTSFFDRGRFQRATVVAVCALIADNNRACVVASAPRVVVNAYTTAVCATRFPVVAQSRGRTVARARTCFFLDPSLDRTNREKHKQKNAQQHNKVFGKDDTLDQVQKASSERTQNSGNPSCRFRRRPWRTELSICWILGKGNVCNGGCWSWGNGQIDQIVKIHCVFVQHKKKK